MSSKKTNKSSKTDVSIWLRVSELFEELRDLTEIERERKLKEVAIRDPLVEVEVRKLLPSLKQIGGFLETPVLNHSISLTSLVNNQKNLGQGDLIGDFKIKRILGKGGFATVYLAEQISLDRLVAVKISENTGREAKTMASLEHDHIVRVFSENVDQKNNLRCICMQYVPGITLEKLIIELAKLEPSTLSGKVILDIIDSHSESAVFYESKQFKERSYFASFSYVEAVLWIGSKISQALSFAHQRGVLHLDVKPANVLLSIFGKPLLTDFNVSKDSRQGSARGQYGGSKTYMSPEQAELFTSRDVENTLNKLDARSDIYSLGIVLKEMFEMSPAVDGSARKILDKATNGVQTKRFISADSLSDALENSREKRTIEAKMPPQDRVLSLSLHRPFVALTFFLVVPSVLGSFVDISYNYFQIVNQLSSEQKRAFELLNLIYKPFIYVVLVGFWVWSLNKIKIQCKQLESGNFDIRNIRKLRRQVLRVPTLGVLLTAIGWGISAVLYPAVIHSVSPISFASFCQFILSFVFSWLVCFSYSFIFHQYLILRIVYPTIWAGREEIRKVSAKELKGVSSRMRKIYLFSSLTPLFGAALILGLGTGGRSNEDFFTLKIFIVACMGIGILGVNFVLSYSQKITQILYALTGDE